MSPVHHRHRVVPLTLLAACIAQPDPYGDAQLDTGLQLLGRGIFQLGKQGKPGRLLLSAEESVVLDGVQKFCTQMPFNAVGRSPLSRRTVRVGCGRLAVCGYRHVDA